MDVPRRTEGRIDVEGDDLDTVAKKLGVESPPTGEKIVLKEDNLRYLNDERDTNGNTILMRFARLGKEDIVEFLVKCDGIRLNERNKDYDTAADIALSERNFGCLLKLLQGEAEFPDIRDVCGLQHTGLAEFVEQRKKLHEDIESGDVKSVETYTRRHKSSKFLFVKCKEYAIVNQSARSWAAECNQLEVYAYLCNHGANFRDLDEEKRCRFKDRQRKELNRILEGYFVKIDDSHVLKLVQSSQSPQVFSDSRKNKIRDLYEHLNELEFLNLMMKVLEYEDVDVVFDFENEHTNDVYCLNNSHIFGFTHTSKQRIFIGAKKCESSETVSMDVAGTLAHELCHMAMLVLYRNEAKPYEAGVEGIRTFEKYEAIVKSIQKDCKDSPENIDPVIKGVFNYHKTDWHCEMIVRVPEMLAMYGDIEGKAKLQEQAKGIFEFYLSHVVPKCKEYTDSAFFKKSLCMIEPLHKHNGCVEDVEKEISPLNEPCKPFCDYLIPKGNISLIVSSNVKLCTLHVYHELKRTHSCHMDKQCLFFKLHTWKSNREKIIDAFKCKVCEYLVLTTNENMLDFEEISDDFEDVNVCGVSNCERMKKVIVIVGEDCEGLSDCSRKKVLHYQWSDLSERYKRYLISDLAVTFKGKGTSLARWIDSKKLSEVIQTEDVQLLTDKEQIKMGDSIKSTTKGYNAEYYMEREFVKQIVNESIFSEPPDSTALFVTGLGKKDIEGIDQTRMQRMEESTEILDSDKRIFINTTEEKCEEYFDKLCYSKHTVDSVIWLHFYNGEFHLRTSKGSTKALEKHTKAEVYTERQLIEASKERVVLISDDPGMGKSTVLAELIRIMREEHPDWWVGRINLNEFAREKENPLSLQNIEENSKPDDVLDTFVRMLGIKTKLQVHLFKQFVKPRGLRREFKVFIDAYDEVSHSYKDNILTLFHCLIEKTSLQMYITTRTHEKFCLEKELKTFSYSLKEFTEEVQVRFLDRLWKHKIKSLGNQNSEEGCLSAIKMIGRKIGDILEEEGDFDWDLVQRLKDLKENVENSDFKTTCHEMLVNLWTGIECLDFTRTATSIIKKAVIKADDNMFLGIPLHLLMLGNVAYDNNFRLGVLSNVHTLYSDFVEGKIRIYWKEKTNSEYAGLAKKRLDHERYDIFKFHKRIAKCVVDPDSHPWDSVADSADLGLDVTVGILTKTGDQLQFVHRTFAEFFFCEWILEMLEHGTLEEEKLREVIREDRHSVVRRFLDGALQRGDIKHELNDKLIKKWNLGEIFDVAIERTNERKFSGNYLLRDITSLFEKRDPKSVTKLFEKLSKLLYGKYYHNIKIATSFSLEVNIFKLLSVSFSDTILSMFFVEHVEPKLENVFKAVRYSPADEVSVVLNGFKKVYRFRARRCRRENNSDGHLAENEGSADSRETDGVGDGGENRMRLFEEKDESGRNVLHFAAYNDDENVFINVFELARELLGTEESIKLVLERDKHDWTMLHNFCFSNSNEKDILTFVNIFESILDSTSLFDMLKQRDSYGKNFLFNAATYCSNNHFQPLMEHLRDIKGVNLLKDLIFEKDFEGRKILHCGGQNEDIEVFATTLKHVRIELKDEKKFKEFVMGADGKGRTVFHHRARWARRGHSISDLTTLLEQYIGRDGLRELVVNVNNKRETWLHKLFKRSIRCNCVLDGLSFISDLIEGGSLEEFILATDAEGNTVMHSVAKGRSSFRAGQWNDVMRALKGLLNESSFENLMNKGNDMGEIVGIVELGDSIQLKLHKQEMERTNVITRIINRLRRLLTFSYTT